jgi:NADH-quinone oxidoreductase subunit A
LNASNLWPLGVYFVAVIVLVSGMLGLSYILGEHHRDRATGEPYESGIVSTGSARQRFSAKFYLIAMLFVIFDLESVFIFAWAVAVRELGWAGYIEVLVFVGVLVAALAYLWREGALEWADLQVRRQIKSRTPIEAKKAETVREREMPASDRKRTRPGRKADSIHAMVAEQDHRFTDHP